MPTYTRIVENLNLTSTLYIEEAEYNNTLVRNVTVHDATGDGIYLKNVNNVRIENCTIYNVTNTGIRLGISGSTTDVVIEGNTIYNTQRDGIASGQREDIGVNHAGLR